MTVCGFYEQQVLIIYKVIGILIGLSKILRQPSV